MSPTFVSEKIIPLIERYGVEVVCVTGGEPTVHPELEQIVRSLASSGARVTLCTSTSRLQDWISQIHGAVTAYQFSLDAADRSTYRKIRGVDFFDQVIAWPGKIRELRPNALIALSCVIQKHNVHQLTAIYHLVRQSGANHLLFQVPDLKPTSWGRANATPNASVGAAILDDAEIEVLRGQIESIMADDRDAEVLIQPRSFLLDLVPLFLELRLGRSLKATNEICPVPFTSTTIGPDGAIFPCFYISQGDEHPSYPDAPNSPRLTVIRDRLLQEPLARTEHCSMCSQYGRPRTSLVAS